MSTIVGTNIEVTNLKFDSDTTSMIISNTGQVTIQGEGTNTTNLQQGLAKAWCKWNLSDQSSAIGSFNIGSITDVGTGSGTVNLTNAFSALTFHTTANGSQYHAWDDNGGSTSSINIAAGNSSHSKVDTSRVYVSGLGDLA